ncbi:DUF58 domain-containing protein [Planctomycetota bacterium]
MTKKSAKSEPMDSLKKSRISLDPASLMRIKSMELRAKVVVEGFWKGIHKSPYHGFSVEFTEYRQYTVGDDPRHIDWRLYARSDRYYIKKFEDETNVRCHVLIDHSLSMGYSSIGYTKAQYAGTLAATLAYFLFTQGDAVGLATFDKQIRQYMVPRNRPGYLHRLMLTLESPPSGKSTKLGPPLQRIAQMLTKRGLVLLISDLLTSIDTLESELNYLKANGHDVVVFNILDPSELNFNFNTPALFEDIETRRNIYVDPPAAQKEYENKLQTHLSSIKSICRNLGIDYHLFATDRPFDLALLEFLHDRMHRRKKQVRRAGGAATRSSI